MPDPETLPQMFQATVHRRGEAPALKAKLPRGGWRTITWQGFGRSVRDFGAFLIGAGVQRGDRVAILAHNSPEWAIADLGIQHAGAASVPIYETLARDKVSHILRDSGARLGIAGSKAQAEELLGLAGESSLEMVVCIEPAAAALGKQAVDWKEALARGAAWFQENPAGFEERWQGVRPDDLATLIYTSGTTGEPKGVMLSHHNFVSNVVSSCSVIPVTEQELWLCFLPLSHSFERMAGHYTPIHVGGTIAYAESVEKLPENLLEVKPTVMDAVPRLFEKLWAKVEQGAKEQGKEKVFQRAVEVGRQYARVTRAEHRAASFSLKLKYRVFDKLVFSKVRARLGGRVKYFVSGGAPIREDLEWNFTAVGLPILGGYGLTESSPVISVNTIDHWRPGSVGRPIPGVEVRTAEDGEILARGPNIMRGYYHRDAETKAALDDEGWLHTGDIGHVDEDGFLYVTDRKKELFKTSGGKYIAPQPIEGMLRASPLIAEAVAIGDNRNFVTALVVPDFEALNPWAKDHGVDPADHDALVRHPQFREALEAEVEKVNAKLSKFETIKKFRILAHELTQEGGELTPTLKVKRRVVNAKYADLIEGMYRGGPPRQEGPEPGSPLTPEERSPPSPGPQPSPFRAHIKPTLPPAEARLPVEAVEGIGEAYGASLRNEGITTLQELLDADGTQVAEKAGISQELVRKWQAQVELQVVKGIGPQYSELLVRAGVRGLEELAAQDAEGLAERLNSYEFSLGQRVQGTVIDPARAEGWIRQARELLNAPAEHTEATPAA